MLARDLVRRHSVPGPSMLRDQERPQPASADRSQRRERPARAPRPSSQQQRGARRAEQCADEFDIGVREQAGQRVCGDRGAPQVPPDPRGRRLAGADGTGYPPRRAARRGQPQRRRQHCLPHGAAVHPPLRSPCRSSPAVRLTR
ncbi:hypothetical protein FM112_05975 [Gulosibacter sp. 10]|nr:hypothetical protein FM112_05975 [Gulosibacter sp. 10]